MRLSGRLSSVRSTTRGAGSFRLTMTVRSLAAVGAPQLVWLRRRPLSNVTVPRRQPERLVNRAEHARRAAADLVVFGLIDEANDPIRVDQHRRRRGHVPDRWARGH